MIRSSAHFFRHLGKPVRSAVWGGASLLALAGCNNDCLNLAKTICQCQPTPTAISSCNNNVSVANSQAQPTAADQARCTALLKVCDCRSLQAGSLQAKVNCGLARENPADLALNPGAAP